MHQVLETHGKVSQNHSFLRELTVCRAMARDTMEVTHKAQHHDRGRGLPDKAFLR